MYFIIRKRPLKSEHTDIYTLVQSDQVFCYVHMESLKTVESFVYQNVHLLRLIWFFTAYILNFSYHDIRYLPNGYVTTADGIQETG